MEEEEEEKDMNWALSGSTLMEICNPHKQLIKTYVRGMRSIVAARVSAADNGISSGPETTHVIIVVINPSGDSN